MSNNDTHVVTTPNKKLAPLDGLRVAMSTGEFAKTFNNYFNGDKQGLLKFQTSAIEYVRKTPKLLECDKLSLLTALANVAYFRFMPSSASGEAYLIPYGKEAKFQIGYQGLLTLVNRTGQVSTIRGNIVYKNDIFEYEEGLEARLVHKPAVFGTDRGEEIGVYTVATMKDGNKSFMVMSKSDVMKVKNLSKAKNSPDSPWNSDKDPFFWMWKKSCLIQHTKLLPKSAEIDRALELEYDGSGFDKPNLDAGGAATVKADHSQVIHDMPSKPSNPAAEDMPPDMGPDININ